MNCVKNVKSVDTQSKSYRTIDKTCEWVTSIQKIQIKSLNDFGDNFLPINRDISLKKIKNKKISANSGLIHV